MFYEFIPLTFQSKQLVANSMSGFNQFFAAAMVLARVDTLSDEEHTDPIPKAKPKSAPKSAPKLKPKGEAKGKAKSKGGKVESKATTEKEDAKEVGEEVEPKPKPERKTLPVMKRPAAAGGSTEEPPAKKPAANFKPLKVYNYQYKNGTYGFKVNGKQVFTVPR